PFGDRILYVRERFDRVLDEPGARVEPFAGALLDLGVSSHQIDAEDRGFTFRRGAPLEMRMGGETGGGTTAADLLNQADHGELTRIFRDLGEEPRAGRLAGEVVRRRGRQPFRTSDDLVAALAAALDRSPSARDKARIFQAVRIAVNDELAALREALPVIRDRLRPGGALVVLAYHSLEDRIVKQAFREWSRSCVCPPKIPVCRCRGEALGKELTRGPLRPSDDEVARNPRSRSARLRAWRKAS
ncbi:MAG: 16S rRNA (cytosine(1402)-N(4))-methyltransferase RsmH, partial [Acidobacteriota bacterium]